MAPCSPLPPQDPCDPHLFGIARVMHHALAKGRVQLPNVLFVLYMGDNRHRLPLSPGYTMKELRCALGRGHACLQLGHVY